MDCSDVRLVLLRRKPVLCVDQLFPADLLTRHTAAPNIFAGEKVAKAAPSSVGAVPPVAAPVEPAAAKLPGDDGIVDAEPPEPSPVRHDAQGNIIADGADGAPRDEAHPIPAEPGAVETPEAAADDGRNEAHPIPAEAGAVETPEAAAV